LLFDIPKNEFEQSIKIIKEEMEHPVCGMTVPIKAEGTFGPNWGEMEKI
jgi:DNA polymerase I-like protein with 3'-5' exonuclease and polymerase domains